MRVPCLLSPLMHVCHIIVWAYLTEIRDTFRTHTHKFMADFTAKSLFAHTHINWRTYTTLPMRTVWHSNPAYGHMFPTHIYAYHIYIIDEVEICLERVNFLATQNDKHVFFPFGMRFFSLFLAISFFLLLLYISHFIENKNFVKCKKMCFSMEAQKSVGINWGMCCEMCCSVLKSMKPVNVFRLLQTLERFSTLRAFIKYDVWSFP